MINIQQFAMNLLQNNPNVAKNPQAQEMLKVIQNGDSQRGQMIGGETLPETTMISVPAAANDLNNVSTTTILRNCCGDYDRLTVVNTGTVPVIVDANTAFAVRRVA